MLSVKNSSGTASKFDALVERIPGIGMEWHRERILENSRSNIQYIRQSIRDVIKAEFPCVVVSAGPSLYREGILPRLKGYANTIVATDGAYIQCLKAGILPDYVVTLDPHPTRMVRWFGDPDLEKNADGDDYFARQDLDVGFRADGIRENQKNIELVDENPTKLIICTTAPANVVARTSHFDRFWFAPLVDDPSKEGITKTICAETGVPALNTGGTVGTAAALFALMVLKSWNVAVVGMDFGYYLDTPLEKTQSFHMLKGDPEMYPRIKGFWGEHYTDPTYAWYLRNFLELLKVSGRKVTNCSEAGLLQGESVTCMGLDKWLAYYSLTP